MAAADRLRAALIGMPIRVPDHLLRLYPELGEARYRCGGLPTRIGGWCLGMRSVAAITLWNTVFLAPGVGFSAELLLHELEHVRQFQASRAFPLKYIWESARVGYHRNRFELSARRFAAQRLRAPASSSPSSGT